MKAIAPVILCQLNPGDVGYDKGRRFRIDTVDQTQFFFATREQTAEFIEDHGMKYIDDTQMDAIREAQRADGEGDCET